MILEESQGHGLKCLGDRRDLPQDIDAVAVVGHHALDAADLTFDPAQALGDGVLVVDVSGLHADLLNGPQYPPRVSAAARQSETVTPARSPSG